MFRDLQWSQQEKKIARAAYEKAYAAECRSILNEVKTRIGRAHDPRDIWRIHDYLSSQRRETDNKYDYRYSVLPMVFARLIQQRWITEEDLRGLDEEKLRVIKTILAF